MLCLNSIEAAVTCDRLQRLTCTSWCISLMWVGTCFNCSVARRPRRLWMSSQSAWAASSDRMAKQAWPEVVAQPESVCEPRHDIRAQCSRSIPCCPSADRAVLLPQARQRGVGTQLERNSFAASGMRHVPAVVRTCLPPEAATTAAAAGSPSSRRPSSSSCSCNWYTSGPRVDSSLQHTPPPPQH
jgi:hypothetical protein